MFKFLLRYLKRHITTYKQAKGEIQDEICVYQSQNVFVCGNGVFPYANDSEIEEIIAINGGG